jgi:hypothetical protein
MTLRISDVAVCCSSASLSARVNRAISELYSAVVELRRRTVFGPLRRFSVAALRRRALTGLPPALERSFIRPPWLGTWYRATQSSTPKASGVSAGVGGLSSRPMATQTTGFAVADPRCAHWQSDARQTSGRCSKMDAPCRLAMVRAVSNNSLASSFRTQWSPSRLSPRNRRSPPHGDRPLDMSKSVARSRIRRANSGAKRRTGPARGALATVLDVVDFDGEAVRVRRYSNP